MDKEYEKAIEMYDKLIQMDAEMLYYVYWKRGLAHQQLGETDKAMADFSKSIQLNRRFGYNYLSRAHVYESLEQWGNAASDYGKAFSTEAVEEMGRGLLLFGRASCLYNAEKYESALSDFNQLVNDSNYGQVAHLYRAMIFKHRGEYERALSDLDQLGSNSVINRERGDVYRLLGQYQKALEYLDQSISTAPKAESLEYTRLQYTYLYRGSVHLQLGELNEALDDLNQAIAFDPEFSEAFVKRAAVLRVRGKVQEAFKDLRQAIRLDPENDLAYAEQAELSRESGDLSQAHQYLEQALSINPESATAHFYRGVLLEQEEEYFKALADFNKAIQIEPNNHGMLLARGKLYRKMGEYTSALADIAAAMELNPKDETTVELWFQVGEEAKSGPKRVVLAEGREDLPVLAVLDFNIQNMSSAEGVLIVDMIGGAIVKTRTYRVIDRGQRDMLLDEIAFSLGDCSDESCQLQVGRLLSADHIVIGSLGEAGSRFVISLKLLTVETGEVLHTAFKVYPSLNDLVDGCEQLARALVHGE